MLGESGDPRIFLSTCLRGQVYHQDEVGFVLAHQIMQSGATSTVSLAGVLVRPRSDGTRYSNLQYMDQHTVADNGKKKKESNDLDSGVLTLKPCPFFSFRAFNSLEKAVGLLAL